MVVINNPAPAQPVQNNSSGGLGFLVGIILLLLMGYLFFVYGLPAIQGSMSQGMNGGVNVNVPKDVNVNVTSEQKK